MSVRVNVAIERVIQEMRGRAFTKADASWLCSQLQYCIDHINTHTLPVPDEPLTFHGIPVIFDESVPPGKIEIRTRKPR